VAKGLSPPLHGRIAQEQVDDAAQEEEEQMDFEEEEEEEEEGEEEVVVQGEEKVRIPHLTPHRWIGLLASSDSGEEEEDQEDSQESGGATRLALSSVVQGPLGGSGQEQETDDILAHVEAHRGAATQESCSQTVTQTACSQADLCAISHSTRDLLAPQTHPSLAILTPPQSPTSPRRLSVCGASSEGEECMRNVVADVGADRWHNGPLGNECRLAAAREADDGIRRQWTQEAPTQEVGGERAEVGGERAEVGEGRADAQQRKTRQLLPQEPEASFSPFRIPRTFLLGASWSPSDSSSEDRNETHGTRNESAALRHAPLMTWHPGAEEYIEGEGEGEGEEWPVIPIIFSQRSSNQSSPHTPTKNVPGTICVRARVCWSAMRHVYTRACACARCRETQGW
jgi:hypothetical protein